MKISKCDLNKINEAEEFINIKLREDYFRNLYESKTESMFIWEGDFYSYTMNGISFDNGICCDIVNLGDCITFVINFLNNSDLSCDNFDIDKEIENNNFGKEIKLVIADLNKFLILTYEYMQTKNIHIDNLIKCFLDFCFIFTIGNIKLIDKDLYELNKFLEG